MVERKKSTKAADEEEVISSTEPVDHTPEKLVTDTDNHTAQNASYAGERSDRGIISVRPFGWVGPSPVQVHESKVDDLIEVLSALKADDSDE